MRLPGKGLAGGARASGKPTTISVLDIGSTKVVCMIAKLSPTADSVFLHGRTHRAEVIGVGHQRSFGVKSGLIIDLDAAEQSIRMAVDAAERMAGMTVDSLIISATPGRLKSQIFKATIELGGEEVSQRDVERVLRAGFAQAMKAERQVVHVLPVSHTLDGERGVRDPKGLVGDQLGVTMHALTADAAPLRNIELCVNRAHLSVESMVATPYASGLAALVEDEMEMGCACIDMGGGSTAISVFAEGRFIHADSVAVGGHHITMDIARGLTVRVEDAERLKVMHASVIPAAENDHDLVTVQPLSPDEAEIPQQIPRAVLNRIVRARQEETLELIRDRLNASGQGAVVGKRVVLTGGAAQLTGLGECARRILGRNVRVGRPLGVAGLPASAKGPAFATAIGLMIYPQVAETERQALRQSGGWRMTGTGGRLHRVGQWLRDSF